MKYLVKLISTVLLICLSFTNAILLWIIVAVGIGDVKEIMDPPTGTLDGSPTPILDTIGQGYRIFFLILLIVMFLTVTVQAVLNIFLVVRAFKDGKYGFFLAFSLNGTTEVIINTIILLVTVSIGAVTMGVESVDTYEKLIFANIIMLPVLITDVIMSNHYAKQENP